jgi:hypothetical protein
VTLSPLEIENIGRNVGHSRVYPRGMVSMGSGCIGEVVVTRGTSVLDSVSIRRPTRLIRDYSTFMADHHFKASPSARCVLLKLFARKLTYFNKGYTSLTDSL